MSFCLKKKPQIALALKFNCNVRKGLRNGTQSSYGKK